MLDTVKNTNLESATRCLEKLKMLIRLIQLQSKFTHFKIQTQLPHTCLTLSKTLMPEAYQI